jgi:hypothetical protein
VHSRGVMDFWSAAVEIVVILIVILIVVKCIHGLCGQTVIMHYYDKYDYSSVVLSSLIPYYIIVACMAFLYM